MATKIERRVRWRAFRKIAFKTPIMAFITFLAILGYTQDPSFVTKKPFNAVLYAIGFLAMGGYIVLHLADVVQPKTSKKLRYLPAKHPQAFEITSYLMSKEAETAEGVRRSGSLVFGFGWVVDTKAPAAMTLDHILWVYASVTSTRLNGLRVRRDWATIVRDQYGDQMTIEARNENEMRLYIKHITSLAPNATQGYSEKLNKLWKRDREQAIAALLAHQTKQKQAQYQSTQFVNPYANI